MLWLVRTGLLAGSDVARGDAGAETHSSASSSSLGDVSRGSAGSLAPTWLLQLSVTVHTLTRYLQTQAAVAAFNFIACTRCCILSQ